MTFTILLSNILFFADILKQDSVTLSLFDELSVDLVYPSLDYIKILYTLSLIISWTFLSYNFLKKSQNLTYFNKFSNTNSNIKLDNFSDSSTNSKQELSLKIGYSLENKSEIIIPEKGLYQNILITGTIGTGKTSSAMYPFLEQFLKQNLGMLILDVKGNFHKKVLELNKIYNRNVIVIELNGAYSYNPLDKPNLKASVIANRLRTILTLFSNQQVTDTYWLDKVEIFLTECIKLCRLYNDKYVTFIELHKLVNNLPYLQEKIQFIKERFLSNNLNYNEIYDFKTCIEFFKSEYQSLDSKVLSIIQSEITRITQLFISDLEVSKTFCPPKSQANFTGFSLNQNEIVVLNMNVAEYRNLAKIIATYLKLDFQSEVLMRLSTHSNYTPLAFLCDEYHEYATENDADFYAQSREAKCISVVSTQSYTSLLKAVKDTNSAKVIIQNLVNKIWFRTDDNFTIEEAQKQLGKEDKTKLNRSISENAKETTYSYILNTFKSDNSSLSESISTQIYHDFIYDFNSFSRDLKTFQAICFLSNGSEILKPQIIQLSPIHQKNSTNALPTNTSNFICFNKTNNSTIHSTSSHKLI